MLRFIVTALTAVTVLWHAVVGCCAHHEHSKVAVAPAKAVTIRAENSQAADFPKQCRCKCKAAFHREAPQSMTVVHENAGSQNRDPHNDLPAAPCDEERCVLTDGKFISAAEFIYNDLLAAWQAFDGSRRVVCDYSTLERTRITDCSAPPLRSHLVLNILLV